MHLSPRFTLTMLIAGSLLAGCGGRPAIRANTAPSTRSSAAATGILPNKTGIAACDDYLSSYLACHQAAAIYPADQLQARFEAMQTNLLRDSQNPTIRPHLTARCEMLSRQLRERLNGKSCTAIPAPVSNTR